MMGHSKQQTHYNELDRLLGLIDKLYIGRRARYLSFQEAIEEGWEKIKNNKIQEVGFGKRHFEAAWKRKDPFKSSKVDDPYYKVLLSLIPKGVDSLLDVGCAEGIFTSKVKEQTGAKRVVGVDISDTAIRMAKERFKDIEFMVQDMRELRVESKFDLILSSQTLYYFHPFERERIYETFEDLLFDDGYLLIAWWTNARRGYHEEKILSEIYRYFHPVHDLTYYSEGPYVVEDHRIILSKKRVDGLRKGLLGRVYLKDKRVLNVDGGFPDLEIRYGWKAKEWVRIVENRDSLDRYRKALREKGLERKSVTLLLMNADKLYWEDGSFDLVLLNFNNGFKDSLFREALRVLRKEGALILCCQAEDKVDEKGLLVLHRDRDGEREGFLGLKIYNE
jgi:ubiquinone/menaquinone biosynthesis C-methylase UbiE